jgi:hypothetical protein
MPKKTEAEKPARKETKVFMVDRIFSGYLNEYLLIDEDGNLINQCLKPGVEDAQKVLLSAEQHKQLAKTYGAYKVEYVTDYNRKLEIIALADKMGEIPAAKVSRWVPEAPTMESDHAEDWAEEAPEE